MSVKAEFLTPEQLALRRKRDLERYHRNKDKINARRRERLRKRYQEDIAYRNSIRQSYKQRYREDSEFRQSRLAHSRTYRQANKEKIAKRSHSGYLPLRKTVPVYPLELKRALNFGRKPGSIFLDDVLVSERSSLEGHFAQEALLELVCDGVDGVDDVDVQLMLEDYFSPDLSLFASPSR